MSAMKKVCCLPVVRPANIGGILLIAVWMHRDTWRDPEANCCAIYPPPSPLVASRKCKGPHAARICTQLLEAENTRFHPTHTDVSHWACFACSGSTYWQYPDHNQQPDHLDTKEMCCTARRNDGHIKYLLVPLPVPECICDQRMHIWNPRHVKSTVQRLIHIFFLDQMHIVGRHFTLTNTCDD